MSIKTQAVQQKTKGQLQAELSLLGNQVEALRKEFNVLSGRKTQIEKDIQKEQALFDSMVLKTTAEMQQQVEKEILEAQEKLKKLYTELEEVSAKIPDKLEEIKNLESTAKILAEGIEKAKQGFETESRLAQRKLDAINEQIVIANQTVTTLSKMADRAKKAEEEAKKNAEAYKLSQKEYADFLDRKTRDLKIWQERLDPLFKQKFPNGEMSFV